MHAPRILLRFTVWLVLGGLVACGDNGGQSPPVAALQSIAITPTAPSVAAGTSVQLTATGMYSNATTADLSGMVTWSSSATTVATVSSTGQFQGVTPGSVTITATLGAISGTASVTVTAAELKEIQVTPTNPSLAAGTTQQLTAMGVFTDNSKQDLTSQVTWASDDTSHAAVSAAGLATAIAIGSANITATKGAITGTTKLTSTAAVLASIAIAPTTPSVALGRMLQLTATGRFTDATMQDLSTQVTWSSATPATATISTTGLVTTVATGSSMITATLGSVSGSTNLSVTAAELVSIAVTPPDPSVAAGLMKQFTATGTFTDASMQNLTTQVAWSSADDAVAQVSNAAGSNGLATTLKVGTAAVSATIDLISGSTTLTVSPAELVSIQVNPAAPTVSAGAKLQFHASSRFTDGSTPDLTALATWASSVPTVATISNAIDSGFATTLVAGTTMISATFNGVTGSTTLTVTDAVLNSIAVTPADPSVAKGRSQQFIATGSFSDGTTPDLTNQVIWASLDPTIATVSNDPTSAGRATTLAVGSTMISATLDGVTGSTSLTVTDPVLDSIAVAPLTASVIPGGTQQYTATGTLTDGTIQDLTKTATWASGDAAIAQVSSTDPTQGLTTGIAVGTTTITAASGAVTGTAAIVVVGPSVAAVSPPDGTSDVRTSTPIVITFNQAIAPATLITQTADGACSGSMQLSADNFATCVGFAVAAPVMSLANTVATATPALRLSPVVTYRTRVLGTVTNAAGSPIGTDFTQATGFTTAGTCAPRIVISQVYGGGGNVNAQFRNDFIELHNVGATPVDLTGFAVQFASAGATALWSAQALPSVTVPAGGHFLIQESVGNVMSTAPPLPTPVFVPGGTLFAMGATSGKVALTPSTTLLTGACPLALTNDFVGYGSGVSCFEGTNGTLAPSNTTSVQRNDGGCDDSNDNRADFTVAAPLPRNSATSSNQCSCSGSVTTNGPADNVSFPDGDESALP